MSEPAPHSTDPKSDSAATGRNSTWAAILGLGYVSLAADMVYEGARSITGPFLEHLGATAFIVGLVTGLGEALALGLRLASGPMADKPERQWPLAMAGYAATAVAVPLMAIAPLLGGAGLAVAATLVLIERTGKAVRSPAKSALLASVARRVGTGKGFGVHKALDQVGAFSGPLVVAGVIALSGHMAWALAVLAIPGAVSLVLLVRTQRNFPDPIEANAAEVTTKLPARFWAFAIACAVTTAGLLTFGVLSYHLVRDGLVTAGWVPVIYAGSMAVAAVAALITGVAFDRWHAKVLLALPLLVIPVPFLGFAGSLPVVLIGLTLWGAAAGVQDSTVKALVADLVPKQCLGSAYGMFAVTQGLGALAGGAIGGALYADHLALLAWGNAALQVLALIAIAVTTHRSPR